MQWKYKINGIREFIKNEDNLSLFNQILLELKFLQRYFPDNTEFEELLDHFDFARDTLTMSKEELEEYELSERDLKNVYNGYLKELYDFADEERIWINF
jgi:hypothetical protein